jgi:segregation and condensation protein B
MKSRLRKYIDTAHALLQRDEPFDAVDERDHPDGDTDDEVEANGGRDRLGPLVDNPEHDEDELEAEEDWDDDELEEEDDWDDEPDDDE